MDFKFVSQYKTLITGSYFLTFISKNHEFDLQVGLIDDLFHPLIVRHNFEKGCPYCGKGREDFCNILIEDKIEIFHQLIEDNKIRLEWLYIPHK